MAPFPPFLRRLAFPKTTRRVLASSQRAANQWPLSCGTAIMKLGAHFKRSTPMRIAAAVLGSIVCTCTVHAATVVAPDVDLIAGTFVAGTQPDGNTVIFKAADGLIVFDTGRHPAHTQQVIDFATAAKLPVVAIVNSHW